MDISSKEVIALYWNVSIGPLRAADMEWVVLMYFSKVTTKGSCLSWTRDQP